jgi:hypothetical protein
MWQQSMAEEKPSAALPREEPQEPISLKYPRRACALGASPETAEAGRTSAQDAAPRPFPEMARRVARPRRTSEMSQPGVLGGRSRQGKQRLARSEPKRMVFTRSRVRSRQLHQFHQQLARVLETSRSTSGLFRVCFSGHPSVRSSASSTSERIGRWSARPRLACGQCGSLGTHASDRTAPANPR